MSHEAVEDRRARLESMSLTDGPLDTYAPNATVMDELEFRSVGGEWIPTAARRRRHTALLDTWRADSSNPPRDRQAILFAGPPAAGKSTLMDGHLTERRRVDADDFKELLLRSARASGTLEMLLPEPLRHTLSEDFHPLELSALVHHESMILYQRALNDAIRAGENIAIDGTLGHKPWARKLTDQLRTFGYKIHVIDVEATQELSLTRIVARWRAGYENAVADPHDPEAAMGGRWLPASAVTRHFTAGQDYSDCEVNARDIANGLREVVRYDLYRASVDAIAPKHEQSYAKTSSGEWTDKLVGSDR